MKFLHQANLHQKGKEKLFTLYNIFVNIHIYNNSLVMVESVHLIHLLGGQRRRLFWALFLHPHETPHQGTCKNQMPFQVLWNNPNVFVAFSGLWIEFLIKILKNNILVCTEKLLYITFLPILWYRKKKRFPEVVVFFPFNIISNGNK